MSKKNGFDEPMLQLQATRANTPYRIVDPKVGSSSLVGHPPHKTRGLQRADRSRTEQRTPRAAAGVFGETLGQSACIALCHPSSELWFRTPDPSHHSSEECVCRSAFREPLQ